MPSTGVPSSNSSGAHFGAPASDTLLGPPERMIPTGLFCLIASSGVLNGTISEYTDSSRSRREINCVYCEPKSSTRIVWWDTNGGIIPQGLVSRRIDATIFALLVLVSLFMSSMCLGAEPKKKKLAPVPLPLLPVVEAWTATLDDLPTAAAAMDAERVYVPVQPERIVALSRGSGAKVWTRDIESKWPPLVIGDAVFVVASDEIHALDAGTGAERWRMAFEHELTAPLSATDASIIAVADKGPVIAIAHADGRTLWLR